MSDAVKSTTSRNSTPTRGVQSTNKVRGTTQTTQRAETPAVEPKDKLVKSKEADAPAAGAGVAALVDNIKQAYGAEPTAGDRVIADARSHLGTKSQDIDAPNYVNTGGNTNNCANFASTMLHNQGMLPGREENVRNLERVAQENGWRLVDQESAGPGDLAFRTDVSHVELVSQPGATHTIGSNNENPDNPGTVVNGQQWVTERSTEGHEFRFYTRTPEEE